MPGNDDRDGSAGLESTLTAPKDGLLRDAADVGLAATADGAAAAGAPAAPAAPGRGDAIGRFRVLERLGSGGMGVVVAAHDPELDRKIAIKLLHGSAAGSTGSGTGGRARLVREAQAMAKLAHPNVVAVYDVGTQGDEVFVAMEYVDGRNLREWLGQTDRSRAEILRVFGGAAEGLVAAHEAGLVHRDFKPANVLVRSDGRAQVSDFGLVGTAGQAVSGARPPDDAPLTCSLTQTGAVIGTPIYMAPEQHRGDPVDARADQFAFCVALYEALYGERPFGGAVYPEVVGNVLDGAVREPPPDADVPGWLRAALLRGLSVDPNDRFPTMRELLDALERDPAASRRRRVRVAAAGALALVAAGAAAFALMRGGAGAPACGDPGERLRGVWDADVRARVQRSFAASGRGTAADTFERVAAELDDYAASWKRMRGEACAATRVRGEQSEQLMDLRIACLDRRRDELAALTAVLAGEPDGAVVDRAIAAALELPGIGACGDTETLLAAYPPPADPALRARVAALRRRLHEAGALGVAGQPKQSLAKAEAVIDDARATGFPPLIAEALYTLGDRQLEAGQHAEAEQTLYEAARVAGEARDDALAARAWIAVLWALDRQGRFEDAGKLAPVAEASVTRAGDPFLRAKLENALGAVAMRRSDLKQARRHYQRALDILADTVEPDHPLVATAVSNLGRVAWERGDAEQADRYHARALELLERRFGPHHPEVADKVTARAWSAMRRGDFDAAVPRFRRALEIVKQTYGADHPETAQALQDLGTGYAAQGLNEQALPYFERAVAIADPDHPDTATILTNYGILLKNVGRRDDSRAAHERALALRTEHFGPDHTRTAQSYESLGELDNAEGKYTDGLERCERALAIEEEKFGPDAPWLAYDLVCIAEAKVGLGDAADAIPILERALKLREGNASPAEVAETQFLLARALWDAGRDRRRARKLAETAARGYRAAGEGKAEQAGDVETWLERHR